MKKLSFIFLIVLLFCIFISSCETKGIVFDNVAGYEVVKNEPENNRKYTPIDTHFSAKIELRDKYGIVLKNLDDVTVKLHRSSESGTITNDIKVNVVQGKANFYYKPNTPLPTRTDISWYMTFEENGNPFIGRSDLFTFTTDSESPALSGNIDVMKPEPSETGVAINTHFDVRASIIDNVPGFSPGRLPITLKLEYSDVAATSEKRNVTTAATEVFNLTTEPTLCSVNVNLQPTTVYTWSAKLYYYDSLLGETPPATFETAN